MFKPFRGIIVEWKLVSYPNQAPRISGKTLGNPLVHDGMGILTSPIESLYLRGFEVVAETRHSIYVLD